MSFQSSSLYVGDLDTEVNEANLHEIFSRIGPVASIRVCRDLITRRSLGYAYVNFHNAADAERALEELNNSPIKERPCRIMWTQRDPSLRKSGKGNVFIKNLDKDIDHKTLYDTFSQFGQILSCKIELDDKKESKGYGYIQFATQEAADKAISKVNGMMLNDKKVFVGPFVTKKERLASNSTKKYTNVYIKNVNEEIDEEGLKTMFSKYGPVQSAIVMRDEQGKSKGFGFVNFEDADAAAVAVDDLNNKEHNGRTLYVGRAQKRNEREAELRQKFEQLRFEQMTKFQGVNLYIKNLDDDFDDEKLRGIFDAFGTITSCKVMRDNKGASKGFGFVCYSSPEEATRAVTEMNGKIVGSKPLYVGLAQRKEIRKAQLEAQFAQRKQLATRISAPIYNGAPAMFYASPGGQPGFVYPQMMPRGGGRFGYQPMPNYVMVSGGRGGQVKNGRGGMVPGSRRGMKNPQPYPVAPAAVPTPVVVSPDAPLVVPVMPPLTAQSLAALPVEEQKHIIGERLYQLIAKPQPVLAGKITGMILDSSYPEEMLQLIDNPATLNEKIDEALKVLKEHEKTADNTGATKQEE